MEIRNLKTFILVAELRSFSQAAQRLGYSQSTVSQHMKKLLVSGLVESRNKESYSYYYVNLGILGKYLDCVKKLNAPLQPREE